jgi:hypothetical protein
MEGRSVVSPKNRMVIVGAAVLVMGAGCGGGDETSADSVAPPAQATPTGPAGTLPEGAAWPNGTAGKVRLEATRLVDARSDALGEAGGRAPAWADLIEVSWQRAGEGATVTFTAAAPPPASVPAPGVVSYGTYLRQNDETVFVAARLDGGTWRVRVADTGRPTDLEVTPRLSGSTVSFDLPGEVNTEDALIDLHRPTKVRAVSSARLGAAGAFTDTCSGSDDPQAEADW